MKKTTVERSTLTDDIAVPLAKITLDQCTITDITWQTHGLRCTRCTPASVVSTGSLPEPSPTRIARKADALGFPLLDRWRRKRAQRVPSGLQLPMFAETPGKTRVMTIEKALRSWNAENAEWSCCRWHVALGALSDATHKLTQRCNRQWQPFGGMQCRECLSLLEEDETSCFVCSATIGDSYFRSSPYELQSLSSQSRQSSSSALGRNLSGASYTLDHDAVLCSERRNTK